ncbi:MAG: 5-(carboxyamino)imidazole ribonucleotide mutase [Deltaproteobacteria bacterium]|nr:5-(carboxyamino)imidazole ribonucleotide mutase [Deltaproteobacteria bacterium]MBW1934644.1 5-(carboxyamino)imidazole ribonucleotide mutase [Deltaproteobacteria bacterium]MBW1977374.1 5-(carboxyamino)imidazole ribonucleotide mutase [Deltaproteobacteria bacterium]MBW2044440.1 5-(carboxyamino)imidazole ribonucleotide mutase [Deltaproteobacteria bacterium]MBW2301207.1 5-(carboxyamino)imidazole ribonucleotide mutase [Deltaproteobacteria bacterium]
MNEERPLVGVVMGSNSDREVMEGCTEVLEKLSIPFEMKVISAHRLPGKAREYAETAGTRGLKVLIAGAGWAAHLAGFLASHTLLPVIGVPIDSSPLKGLDALLSTVQMPPGVPVATVALGAGGARNAALLAAQILSIRYQDIADRLKEYRENMAKNAARQI